MQKIVPHLWFDTQAKEAANFYLTVFENARIKSSSVLKGTPSGDTDFLTFELEGFEFMAISAGPYFQLNPSVSFLIACKTKEEVDALWSKLIDGGSALMELASYPFSERYGWLKDRYGVSWQIMFMGDRPFTQKITPTVMFVGDQAGNAEAAINFYVSIFRDAKVGNVMRYNEGEAPDKAGTIRHASYTLENVQFAAMDSAHKHEFAFNEAVSFVVRCDDQEEIDYYWAKLSADPKSEQCGWLKDKFGFSWQVTPVEMDEMLVNGTEEQKERVTKAFLRMKKFDLKALREAYEGK